jgi:hypothetical protein
MEGEGVYIWQSGAEYRGEYKNDLKHGKGSFKQPDLYGKYTFRNMLSKEYEGEWFDGVPINTGKLRIYKLEKTLEVNWDGQKLQIVN